MTTRITDTHDPDITVTLDSGSHINDRIQPRAERDGCNARLAGSRYSP